MQITLNWLKKHIKFHDNVSIQLITENLTDLGIEVEDIQYSNPLVAVEVLKVEKVEGLKVSICQVNLQGLLSYEKLQVLCGADNVKEGMITIMAPIGTKLNNDFTIMERTIRGYKSQGMFTSKDELSELNNQEKIINLIENNTDGIVNLKNTTPNTIVYYDDIIINISVPTNRWDLKNVRGIARELASKNLGLIIPLPCINGNKESNIIVKNNTNVPMSFLEVYNIKINDNILDLMETIGKKSHNPLQTLNDFILLDIGHPIHIYDASIGNNIIIRNSNYEIVKTLNGKFQCSNKEILIENEKDILSIGGIIGASGFNQQSNNVIIEAGYFCPENITKNITESAKIFALKIDYEQSTLLYVNTLITGEIYKVIITPGNVIENPEIFLSWSKFYKFTAIALSLEKIENLLKSFGFECKIDRKNINNAINDEFGILVKAPSWRSDILDDEDVIEEIIRIDNNNLKRIQNLNKIKDYNSELTIINREQIIRDQLIFSGFNEVYNLPFTEQFLGNELKIINSINSDKSYLRSTLLFSLLDNCQNIFNLRSWGCKIFEIGKIYSKNNTEEIKLGVLLAGKSDREIFNPSEPYSFFKLKKNMYDIAGEIDKNAISTSDDYFLYKLEFNKGFIGKLKYSHKWNLVRNAYYFEIPIIDKIHKFTPIGKIYKDLSLTMDSDISWQEVSKSLSSYKYYRLYDIYESNGKITYNIHVEE